MAATTLLRQQAGVLLSGRASRVNWGSIWTAGGIVTRRNASGGKKKGSGGMVARTMRSEMARQAKRMVAQSPKSEALADSMDLKNTARVNILIPGTFLTPPFSKFPPVWSRTFAKFTYAWLRQRVMNNIGAFAMWVSSKPKWHKSALFSRNRASLVPTAKSLHVAMSEALAAGDRTALGRICVEQLQARLGAAITARPRGRRYVWELVKYNKTPRIRDTKVTLMQLGEGVDKNVCIYQAVVTIASRQRLVQYDDTPKGKGKKVNGSEKVVDLEENLVISSIIDKVTYQQSEWRVWGTVKETTPESWFAEKAILDQTDAIQKKEFKAKNMT